MPTDGEYVRAGVGKASPDIDEPVWIEGARSGYGVGAQRTCSEGRLWLLAAPTGGESRRMLDTGVIANPFSISASLAATICRCLRRGRMRRKNHRSRATIIATTTPITAPAIVPPPGPSGGLESLSLCSSSSSWMCFK